MIQLEMHNESQQLDPCSVFQALQKVFMKAFSSLGLDERKGKWNKIFVKTFVSLLHDFAFFSDREVMNEWCSYFCGLVGKISSPCTS